MGDAVKSTLRGASATRADAPNDGEVLPITSRGVVCFVSPLSPCLLGDMLSKSTEVPRAH